VRLFPSTLYGRVALVLGGGLVLTLAAALAVLGFAMHAGGPAYPAQIQRVATAIAIADRLPPEVRAQLAWRGRIGWMPQPMPPLPGLTPPPEIDYREVDVPGDARVGLMWPSPGPLAGTVATDWVARHLKGDVEEALARAGLNGPVAITHGLTRWGDPPAPDHHPRRLVVQARLSDGTWAAVPLRTSPFRGPGLLPGLVAALAVFSGGVAALAVWAAGRVTEPLKRLAEAAGRMEAAGDAPPAEVAGPREVRQAAHALNQMAARLRRFVDDRTRMLAAVSHDLRTMLTRLALRAEYIEDPEQRAKAQREVAEMEEMLSATLAFARDDAKAEARTPVDLGALLADLADDLTEAGRTASYSGPRALTVHARPVALRRALMNVLTNAVAYGGGAEVGLAAQGGTVTVTVSDRGPGIPDAYKEKVFDPFFRIETSRSRETGGTGLGLSVARDIVRGHGGDIALSDREGGGLVATVTLPQVDVGG
jgi:signal transduction histidine kinase